jgi:hypothetical protein
MDFYIQLYSIIGPDGQPLSLATAVTSTSNSEQLTVVFFTQFPFSQVPGSVLIFIDFSLA